MEYMQMTLNDWVEMKEKLKKDLIGVQESFVRIGYTLRQIEEKELYKQDGYANITEFAKAEYGLGASTVSRFISINRKYSVDGYSDRLRPEFVQLGSSKLAEMLSLPDGDMEMIQLETTRGGIRDLKQFNKEEPTPGVADDIRELIEKFFENNREILNELYSSDAYITGEIEQLVGIVNPGGNKTFKKGLFFMMMYEEHIKIKRFGANPQTMPWAEFFTITQEIFSEAAAGPKTWQSYFGEEKDDGELAGTGDGEAAAGTNPGDDITRDMQEDTRGTKRGDGAGKTEYETGSGTADTEPMLPGDSPMAGTDTGAGETGLSAVDGNEDRADQWGDDTTGREISPGDSENTRSGALSEPDRTQEAEETIAPAQKSPEILEVQVLEKNEKNDLNRRKYMDGLTEYGMALYLAAAMKTIDHARLEESSFWEEWLTEKVDEWGNELE